MMRYMHSNIEYTVLANKEYTHKIEHIDRNIHKYIPTYMHIHKRIK